MKMVFFLGIFVLVIIDRRDSLWRHYQNFRKKVVIASEPPGAMPRVRCAVCRHQLPNLKTLKSHYVSDHSKIQIIKELLKSSLLNATPGLLARAQRRRDSARYQTVYLHDKIQITYSADSIVIADESNDDNVIEVTFNDAQTYTLPSSEQAEPLVLRKEPEKRRRFRKARRNKKLFRIGIRKVAEVPKSLHEHTGEFYECHCKEKSPKNCSDTESSGSDTGKGFYCGTCGNGYASSSELTEHESLHQYYCKLCKQIFNVPNHREHFDQHLVRIYVCHLCGFEFVCKDILMGHLGYHFEQQTFENILNMEQDYNMYAFCNTNFAAGDYYSNINSILLYLTYPYDHYYSRNMFMKVVCDICYQEFHIYDYERHLKLAHFIR